MTIEIEYKSLSDKTHFASLSTPFDSFLIIIMFKSLALVSLTLSLIGASANPVRRANCNPNPQGQPVSIQSASLSGLEWGLAAPGDLDSVVIGESYRGLAAPDWFVRQSGQFPTSYIITYDFIIIIYPLLVISSTY